MNDPKCPKCKSENTYNDGTLWICPDCSHEWSEGEAKTVTDTDSKDQSVRDAFGNVLASGDSVSVIKDLKLKGSSSVVKVGTKVRNIRIVDSDNGHPIACKIDGIGAMYLKPEFVKKV